MMENVHGLQTSLIFTFLLEKVKEALAVIEGKLVIL